MPSLLRHKEHARYGGDVQTLVDSSAPLDKYLQNGIMDDCGVLQQLTKSSSRMLSCVIRKFSLRRRY